MNFTPFHERCPEIAAREMWRYTLQKSTRGLPAGDYLFVESYCSEPGCDCRRVFLNVIWQGRPGISRGQDATIGFGWERPEFYIEWMAGDESGANLAGANLEPMQRQGPMAEALLEMTKAVILSSPGAVDWIKRHYAAFKASVEATAT